MLRTPYDITVIICTYTDERWEELIAAVESVQHQTLPPVEIIVVIDHNSDLLKRVQEHIKGVLTVENQEVRGLSGARNSGVTVAQGVVIAFLDDDAIAEPDWLKHLEACYTDPSVLGAGGKIEPLWLGTRPSWFPNEFNWVVGCTYQGMPQSITTIRNPIGANMSFRPKIFDIVGGFRSEVGRIGTRLAGCEETELCIRAIQCLPQDIFLYQPLARVNHRVPSSRISWHYFCSRCYAEGLSKAIVTRFVGAKASLASERTYTLRTLPQGVMRGLSDVLFHHDLTGLARAGAIVVGLAVTTAGYLVGSLFSKAAKSGNGITTEAVLCRNAETPLPIKTRL